MRPRNGIRAPSTIPFDLASGFRVNGRTGTARIRVHFYCLAERSISARRVARRPKQSLVRELGFNGFSVSG